MATMTQDWTDSRIDDFAQRVDNGFAQVDGRFEQVDARFAQVDRRFEQIDARFAQVDRRFEQVDARFAQVDRRFEQVHEEQRELRIALERNSAELRSEIKAVGDGLNQRFDRLQQVLLAGAIAATVTMIAAIVTLIVS